MSFKATNISASLGSLFEICHFILFIFFFFFGGGMGAGNYVKVFSSGCKGGNNGFFILLRMGAIE